MLRTTPVPALVASAFLMMGAPAYVGAAGHDLPEIRLPEGFAIEMFARDVPNARQMALGEDGTLFVGTTRDGRVWGLRTRVDASGAWRAEGKPLAIAKGLTRPNGVAFRDGDLYVAEVSRITRYRAIESRLDDPPRPEVIASDYPKDTHHGSRHIGFGPDGRLYVPIGAPCNVCEKDGYALITRLAADGSGREVFARGIRNTVGFDWHPETDELWFTDNGRDRLGDDRPPDELNHAPEPGLHFGFPFCHGGDLPDPELGKLGSCSDARPPAQKLGPHVAALGMTFYTADSWPAQYRNQIFIAEHGSWNRSEEIGYRVTMVKLEGGEAVGYEPFAEGWLRNGHVMGRPVDLLVLPDGSMLVSDDKGGRIYRISWHGSD